MGTISHVDFHNKIKKIYDSMTTLQDDKSLLTEMPSFFSLKHRAEVFERIVFIEVSVHDVRLSQLP